MTTFQLPALPYAPEALEPIISAEIMQLHHGKHHQAYVTNLNKALEQYAAAEQASDLATMIELQPAIRFNGGGHLNHSIFWSNLAPKGQGGGVMPSGALLKAIEQKWHSLDSFIAEFSKQAIAIQGSGWGWLAYHREQKCLRILTLANQDPVSTLGFVPLLGIDVWEHAYYLQYKNARADYVKAIWEIINWKNVEERYLAASGS
jgi:Fe-Mn family superoxide dismutase